MNQRINDYCCKIPFALIFTVLIAACGGGEDKGGLAVKKVSRDGAHVIALREDGTVKVVDSSTSQSQILNEYSIDPPLQLEGVEDVFTSKQGFIAIHDDGDLTVWGNENLAYRSEGEENVRGITSSWGYLTFFRGDGLISYWSDGVKTSIVSNDKVKLAKGRAFLTETGALFEYDERSEDRIFVADGVKDFTIGEDGNADLALLEDGGVISLGNDTAAESLAPYSDYIKIDSSGIGGRTHNVLGLRSSGDVVVWSNAAEDIPNLFNDELHDLIDIQADDAGCFTGLRKNGEVISWGWCGNYRDVSVELSQ